MTQLRLIKIIEQIFDALTIDGQGQILWHGRFCPSPPEIIGDSDGLEQRVASLVYSNAYARSCSEEYTPLPLAPRTLDQDFLHQLETALATQNRLDPGWTVHQTESNGQLHVSKSGRYRILNHGDYTTSGTRSANGQEQVSVRVIRSSQTAQRHFYFAFGDQPAGMHEMTSSVRFFFNAQPDIVPNLLQEISTSLNYFQIPFLFKCLDHRENYYRSDGCVLFIGSRHYEIGSRLVIRLAAENNDSFRAEIPLFSKAFAKGVGVAEDPGTGESFGQSRCKLVARAFIDWDQNSRSADPTMVLKNEFSKANLDLTHPYLNPGSVDFLTVPLSVKVGRAEDAS